MEFQWGERAFRVRGREARHRFLRLGDVVAVLALDPEGRVLLVRQYRAALDRHTLEVPAGYCEPGEAPADAAARELEEETGYRPGRLRPLLAFWPVPGYSTERMHVFAADGLLPGATRFDPEEDIELVRLAPAECDAAARRGRLEDGKTLLAWAAFRLGWGPAATAEGSQPARSADQPPGPVGPA